MKRVKIFLFIFSFGLLVGCNKHNNQIPVEFSQHIISLVDTVEYKTVIPYNMDWRKDPFKAPPKICPKYISKADALEDIDLVVYLLQTTYGKCDYWKKKGCKFLSVKRKSKKRNW